MYYLARWSGAGTEADPYRPDLPLTGAWQAVDLRPDATVPDGWCVVWTADPQIGLPSTATELGDGTFAALPNALRNRLRNLLGIASLTGSTVPQILAELLTVHAGPGRWQRLRPSRRQTAFGLVDHYEVHLGGKISEWDEAVTP